MIWTRAKICRVLALVVLSSLFVGTVAGSDKAMLTFEDLMRLRKIEDPPVFT